MRPGRLLAHFLRLTAPAASAAADLPPLVEPHPLAGVLTHPALDHFGEELGGSRHVDAAALIARQGQFVLDFEAETIAGQPDAARRIDVAVIVTGQHAKHGIALAT